MGFKNLKILSQLKLYVDNLKRTINLLSGHDSRLCCIISFHYSISFKLAANAMMV